MKTTPIDPRVPIGHVHLKVADLERSIRFHCDVLGFELQQRYGSEAAFVSARGYHHHIGLNTWESKGGSPPPPRSTGLFHLAILYPTRALLADASRRPKRGPVEVGTGTVERKTGMVGRRVGAPFSRLGQELKSARADLPELPQPGREGTSVARDFWITAGAGQWRINVRTR